MSKPKFTPGPWAIPQPWSGFSKIVGPNGELVFGISTGSKVERQPAETCEANADLIAAAPELYAALVAALPYVRYSKHEYIWQNESDKEGVLKMMLAALQKAHGEEAK